MASKKLHWLTQPRRAGVFLHLTSLPGCYGIGETGEAAFRFVDILTEMNLHVWQFLPIGPTGFGNSPYQSFSTFAGNELLIDMAAVVQAGLLTRREVRSLKELPGNEVDFGRLIPQKTALLRLAAKRFPKLAPPDLKSEFDRFQDQHDHCWLHDYALFRTLKSRYGEREWLQWPGKYRDRDSRALRKLEAQAGKPLEQVKIIQFLFHYQWRQLQQYANSKGILLFGDMPIYVALDSADAWAARRLLQVDENGCPELVAGVPPDYFSTDGQLWGNPVYDWKIHAAEHYQWWVDRIRHSSQMVDLVRIDHFRGFESYFAIKKDARTARDGEWHKGPGDALFDILRNSLGEVSIVAEDLGEITPEVDALRLRHRIPGMKVLQFEVLRDDFDISRFGDDCVIYTGTHDNDTTVGWYRDDSGGKVNTRALLQRQKTIREACNGRAATIHLDMIELAFGSKAKVAIAPAQDYLGLGSEARLNIPGTTGKNWRWRFRFEQIDAAVKENVAQLVDDNDRNAAT